MSDKLDRFAVQYFFIIVLYEKKSVSVLSWRNDTRHNDIQHFESQQSQHNDKK
jgi:hypothetical protein